MELLNTKRVFDIYAVTGIGSRHRKQENAVNCLHSMDSYRSFNKSVKTWRAGALGWVENARSSGTKGQD